MPTAVTNVGDAILYSLTQALTNFMAFLPELIGAIVILIIGWLISGFLAGLIERGLAMVGFERAVQHSGIGNFIRRTGTNWTTSKVIAELVKWFIRLIFIQAAANVLGMPQVTAIINSIVLFIPNVIVAMIIIVVGSLLANFLAAAVRGSVSEMGFSNANILARLTQYAVMGFAIIAAINQLNIATTIVDTLFMGFVAALALAFGLAFGLGGREVAGRITQSWYEGGKTMAQRAQEQATQPTTGAEAFNSQQTQPANTVPGNVRMGSAQETERANERTRRNTPNTPGA